MAVNLTNEQFKELLATIPGNRKTITACNFTFDGRKEAESVEAFLAGVRVFKDIEKISDVDVIKGLPLLLQDEAGSWWQGIKDSVNTWEEFERRLRTNFAPKKPAFILYQELMTEKQDSSTSTATFIARKRLLFSLLPAPAHPEIQQLDMIYGLLNIQIRDRVPRSSVDSYDRLLSAAHGVEQVLKEQNYTRPGKTHQPASHSASAGSGRVRCNFCKILGHTSDVCRKKKWAESKASSMKQEATGGKPTGYDVQLQMPSPSVPKFACYGCGTPGVVRTSCPTCAKQPRSHPIKKESISFCSMNVQTDARSRPVVCMAIKNIQGYAYVDTCAKASVASYHLYCQLRKEGYQFKKETVELTLADGIPKRQVVLTVRVEVQLCGRIIPTTFLVLPESRDNRTLLGMGFLQDALVVLNLAQFTWWFLDEPDETHELYQEDFLQFEFEPKQSISILNASVEPTSQCQHQRPSCVTNVYETGDTGNQPSKIQKEETGSAYRLRRIEDTVTTRRYKTFDGYSPRLDYMMRDAQISINEQEVTLSPHSQHLFPGTLQHYNDDVGINSLDVSQSSIITDEQQDQLRSLLNQFEDVFSPNPHAAKYMEHRIDTMDNRPITVPPYRLSAPRREILKKELDKMLQEGIIEPQQTPWAAPVVLVPKPNGETRVCVDYRRLNAITVPDPYPIPRVDDLLHDAKPTPFMSTLDLKAGYWQISVREEDREKTGFITPYGIFIFLRMPFGLRNAPATFQRLIDRFRVDLNHVKMLAYLDDLIIFSTSFQAHLQDLAAVLEKMREYNLTVNRQKCRFGCSTIRYLGHYITPEGLRVDPSKVSAILDLPTPSNVQHLLTFLQTCSWYRRFINNFSTVAEPLTRLTKKNASWKWASEQETAYKELKRLLTTAPILKQADERKPYVIKTDASGYALGAVLVQGEGAEEHPVEYASRLLTSAERNYSTTEREALAVVWAVTKYRGYIEGVPTVIKTDHHALKWLLTLKSPSGRLARWALILQAFDLTIEYTPGRTNLVADALSRPPCTENNVSYCGVCGVTVDMPVRSPADIRTEQRKDAIYWSGKGYLMNNGLLYRHSPYTDSDDAQLVVPEHEWAHTLHAYHDDPLAGHYGVEKTLERIAKRYFWKGMRKYVESYVRQCVSCQRYKPSNHKPAGLLQTTSMNKRFEVIAFDLFGPLPASPEDKTWIFIVEDVATRWVELFALKFATAESCAEILLNEIFLRFGTPRRVISDNGPQFVSAVLQQVVYCLRIKHSFTPVYHPEANPVERRNRDLKTQLAILVEGDHSNWPDQLSSIRFAMNTAVCSSTGYSPAYLTFGRELRMPAENEHDFREIILSENFIPEITPKLLQISDTLNKAREIQELKEEARKEYFDTKRKESPSYSPGDLVMAKLHPISNATRGFSAKFAPRRDGPYKIIKRCGPASYQIANPEQRDTPIGTYHSSALEPYRGDTESLPDPVQPLRRRGRPRKQPVQAPKVVKRGRGRPRKQ